MDIVLRSFEKHADAEMQGPETISDIPRLYSLAAMSTSASNVIAPKKRASSRQRRVSSQRGASNPRSLARSPTPESWEVRILAGLPPARRDHGRRPAEMGLRVQAMHHGIELNPVSSRCFSDDVQRASHSTAGCPLPRVCPCVHDAAGTKPLPTRPKTTATA